MLIAICAFTGVLVSWQFQLRSTSVLVEELRLAKRAGMPTSTAELSSDVPKGQNAVPGVVAAGKKLTDVVRRNRVAADLVFSQMTPTDATLLRKVP